MSIEVRSDDAGVARVTINNPDRRNALDEAMFRQLADLWPRLEADSAVRCVLLAGAGSDAFCSGADLSADWSRVADRDELIDRALLKTSRFPKPVVAAINGHCVAGGLELALSADVRAVRRGARLGLPEVRWGIFPSGGAAMKLPDQIPRTLAMEMLLTGRLIDAEQALAAGLVGRVLDAAGLERWGEETAERIAANSPAAVQAVKRFCDEAAARQLDGVRALEDELVAGVRASGQAEEGIAAFLEKRTPVYRNV